MRNRIEYLAIAVCTLLFFSLSKIRTTASEVEYEVIPIGNAFTGISEARDINENGVVVGYRDGTLNEWAYYKPFIYSNGIFADLSAFENCETAYFYNINNNGLIAGTCDSKTFVHSGYTTFSLPDLGHQICEPKALNDLGDVVGFLPNGAFSTSPYIYSDGEMRIFSIPTPNVQNVFINDINNKRQIIGSYSENGTSKAFIYSLDKEIRTIELLGDYIEPVAINDNGDIAVSIRSKDSTSLGIYRDGIIELPLAPATGQIRDINDHKVIVGDMAVSAPSPRGNSTHAFIYTDGIQRDLNDLIAPNSGWVLMIAHSINNKGQIVGMGIGPSPTHYWSAFLLNPTGFPKTDIGAMQPAQPVYGECIEKEAAKDSLILVTHGWTMKLLSETPKESPWVDEMTNALSSYLSDRQLENWQVVGYKWKINSWTKHPDTARNNATQQGFFIGNCIATQNWKHVHLIAHSAGSALIQAMTERIKILNPSTFVHLTFLDPYVGTDYAGINDYGRGADWAENYFAHDAITGGEAWPFTESMLSNAYNVEVTYLDTNKLRIGRYWSSEDKSLKNCYRTVSSHDWPIHFYTDTIKNVGLSNRGFSLSAEFNNLPEPDIFKKGNTQPEVLGVIDQACESDPFFENLQPVEFPINFQLNTSVESTSGQVEKFPTGITLSTGSPVWISTKIITISTLNFVSFEAQYLPSDEAQGLLSVYWHTNHIGFVDERVAGTELSTYKFVLPIHETNKTGTLTFRLDSFSENKSKIILTNVVIGRLGPTQPFRLVPTTNRFDGIRVYEMEGQSGFSYSIETTTNLVDWTTIAQLFNTNGVVSFTDSHFTNQTERFYRAVWP